MSRRLWRAGVLALLGGLLHACTRAAAPPPLPVPVEPLAVEPAATDWPRREVLDLALAAYGCGEREGRFQRPVLSVIDYSLPSSEPRLWVIDLTSMRVLHHELVAHGERSGDVRAVAFSNQIGSHQSSLGLFRTDEVYSGQFGYSLRLSGLEPGVNDNARARAIVMHGASYVSKAAVAQWGSIGTTFGCPGLPEEVATQVIDDVSGGSAVFAYYPDQDWLRDSRFLHCDGGEVAAAPAAGEGEARLMANELPAHTAGL